MPFLVVETSTPQGSIAIVERNDDNGKVLFEKSWSRKKVKPKERSKNPSHSELVTLYIEEALKNTGLNLQNLDFFMTSVGPGSFTGIRVGVNLVKSFCFALNKPFAAIDSLFALAINAPADEKKIVCMQNAFRNEVYFSSFERNLDGTLVGSSPKSVPINEISQCISKPNLCLGDAFAVYHQYLEKDAIEKLIINENTSNYPSASMMGLYFCKHDPCLEMDWKLLNPLYIRSSEAEEKLSRGLLKPLPKL